MAADDNETGVSDADRQRALVLTPVSRETEERLTRYVSLLVQWQRKTNLVAPSTVPTLWTRHVADSLQLLDLAPQAKRWLDIGSGGGFPGIVLACALPERGGQITLVERNAKKAAFLREALRVTGGAGTVVHADIGDSVERVVVPIDCVTARAVAPLHQLIAWAEPWLREGALGLFPKGQDVGSELTEAARYWNMEYQLHPSRTGGGAIVTLRAANRREKL